MQIIKINQGVKTITTVSAKGNTVDYQSTKKVFSAPEIRFIIGEYYVLKKGTHIKIIDYDKMWNLGKKIIKSRQQDKKERFSNKFKI